MEYNIKLSLVSDMNSDNMFRQILAVTKSVPDVS